jgi:hypothetical protein
MSSRRTPEPIPRDPSIRSRWQTPSAKPLPGVMGPCVRMLSQGRRQSLWSIPISNGQEVMGLRSRGLSRPSFASRLPCSREEGAGKTGCALHPRSRVQMHKAKRTRAYRFSGNTPAFPARWFTAYFALFSATGFLATVASRINPQSLTPASGRQNHTTSPSASRAVRQRRIRVHRIPPRVS